MFYIKSKLSQLLIIIYVFFYRIKANTAERKIVDICKKLQFSTTTEIHLWHFLSIFKKIDNKKIMGDFIECGVWKGIYLVFFQKLIEYNNLENCNIYAFDTYEGMPEPTSSDLINTGKSMIERFKDSKLGKNTSSWNNASLDEVKENYLQNTLLNKNLIQIKGMVETTLLEKKNIPEKISILKLDTNLYEGTKIELEVLFPKVQSGGFIIIDNYTNYKGIQKAVDEYFASDISSTIKYYPTLSRIIILKK